LRRFVIAGFLVLRAVSDKDCEVLFERHVT